LSFGPVFWLMSAEIFPTRVRAIGASISAFANWTANLLVSITFLSLIGALGAPRPSGCSHSLGLSPFSSAGYSFRRRKGKAWSKLSAIGRTGVIGRRRLEERREGMGRVKLGWHR